MKKLALKNLVKVGKASFSLVLPKNMLTDLGIDPENDQVLIYNDGQQLILKKFIVKENKEDDKKDN